jgi:oxygen-independent coproporphyrinogen-3 oxidase
MCNLQHSSIEPFDAAHDPTLRALQEEGFVAIDAGGVSVTETGRYALHQLWGDASPSYRWGSLL